MLKFLRKYQLILLAVGGSLLMVVFLLQPVLQQLTPNPLKRTVAKIGDTKVTLGDQTRANAELDLLERFMPLVPALMRIDPKDQVAHWLLLKYEAERAGLMGVRQDGVDWLQELALFQGQQELVRRAQMGQQITPEMQAEVMEMSVAGLEARKNALTRGGRVSESAFYETLAEARGVMRLRTMYERAPRLSRQRTLEAFERLDSAVLIDQVVLGPELIEVEPPTEEELAEQLARYADRAPGEPAAEGSEDASFGFGYLLPGRVKLEWLTLDPGRIAESVTADAVQVRRRWQEGDKSVPFEDARAGLEAQIEQEQVGQILADADEVIRGELLASLRGIARKGPYRDLPDDWTPPDLERIAGDVVAAIEDRHGVRIERPVVNRRTDAWLTPQDLRSLPGVGRATYRVGTQQAGVDELPSLVRGVGDRSTVPVQVGLPVIDPVAVGPDGSRYYITILDAVGESAPSGVDEIRERLVRDVKEVKAYREHMSRLDAYREAAERDGLDALVAMFPGEEGGSNTAVLRENIFVTDDRLVPAFSSFPDMRADREVFRDAVLAEAEDLDPLAEPDSLPLEESIVGVGVPSTRVVAFGRIRARIPGTIERYQRLASEGASQVKRELRERAEDGADPLGFRALADRLGYREVGGGADDSAPEADEVADADAAG